MRRNLPAPVGRALRNLSPALAVLAAVRAPALVALSLGGAGCAGGIVRVDGGRPERALKAITINTQAYTVAPGAIDRRSASLVAPEDMHITAIEHFTGVQKGGWSDNGHILSLRPENPWSEWQAAGTGMEPTGATGYFGYCGRDYYTEVGGIGDVTSYEALPAGTHVLVPRGATLHLHTYANNFLATPQAFHHAVRLLYW